MARFGGRHALSVAGQDNIILFVNKLGIDIQGKDEVVFGFDLEIGNNIVKGDIPVRGAFSIRQLADAYVVLMNLNDVLEDVLTGYGINSLPIKSAVKTFFSSADGKIELWRQKFGALLDNYFNNLEKKYDLFVADEPNIELLIGDKPDNIAINLEMVIKSEKQYFWVDNMILSSNKKFELMDIVKKTSTGSSKPLCMNLSSDDNNQVNLKNSCSIKSNDLYLLRIKTKHGGIINFLKFIE